MEVGWKIKDEYIYCFMKFSYLLLFKPIRSVVKTIVKSAPFAFQHVQCRCCFPSYLDRYLI